MLNNLILDSSSSTSSIIWLVILVVLIVVMLVMPSVTQKKRVKAYEEMKSRLRAGDKVQTIGGIVGKIVKIKEANGVQTVLIETGDKSNKMTIEFDINAIAGVVEGLNNTKEVVQATAVEPSENEEEKEEQVDVSFDKKDEETKQEEKQPKQSTKKKSNNLKK